MRETMDEREYHRLADAALAAIEARLEESDIDYEFATGGVMEIDLDDGTQIVVNKQSAAQEIWVAAKSGGFHFRWSGSGWEDTRSGEDLHAVISRLASS